MWTCPRFCFFITRPGPFPSSLFPEAIYFWRSDGFSGGFEGPKITTDVLRLDLASACRSWSVIVHVFTGHHDGSCPRMPCTSLTELPSHYLSHYLLYSVSCHCKLPNPVLISSHERTYIVGCISDLTLFLHRGCDEFLAFPISPTFILIMILLQESLLFCKYPTQIS
jgi:hypothetical protein